MPCCPVFYCHVGTVRMICTTGLAQQLADDALIWQQLTSDCLAEGAAGVSGCCCSTAVPAAAAAAWAAALLAYSGDSTCVLCSTCHFQCCDMIHNWCLGVTMVVHKHTDNPTGVQGVTA